MSRRAALRLGTGAIAAGLIPISGRAATHEVPFVLRPAPARADLRGPPFAATDVWAYNGRIPGPEIRVRQGDRIRVLARNGLAQDTTIHWHGLRLPNAMDGVPDVTQPAIPPGGEYLYEFDALDAGSFWYHPHVRSSEQVGRGLSGPLIVEEADPIRVDRDLTWMLNDWRMTPEGPIAEDFGAGADALHAGRIGNAVTINGRVPAGFPVRAGERIRLRLINAANARIFGLEFGDLSPVVVALDGQPVAPHGPAGGRVLIGPGMRVDLVLDMSGRPGSRTAIVDRFYRGLEYRLADLVYDTEPLRAAVPDWPLELPPNPLAEPALGAAARHEIAFHGGMMGQALMGAGMASMTEKMRQGSVWFVNGEPWTGTMEEPLLTLPRDTAHVLALDNRTAWYHPIHLHGHSFRVIARNGLPTARREWQDTVLMAPEERVEIALVADNPGDWMFHCHILEHAAAGMMAVIRVGDAQTET